MSEKTVVISGVGRGLGRELAKAFANDGDYVCGISRSSESITSLGEELSGTKFLGIAADVADPAQVDAAFDEIFTVTGRVDVLFNNAAVYNKVNFLEESSKQWLDAIMINLGGVSNCCKAALPHMVNQSFGRIYNVGSWADLSPALHSAAYATSKGGLRALTKSIARDIAALNLDIEVHEWIPGHLNTRMSDFTGIDPALSAQWGVAMVQAQASKKNSIFENDHEWFPPKRLKERLLFWR